MISKLKKAYWISSGKNSSEALFRQSFTANKIKKATIIFGVLGIYEAYINGKRIGDDYYLPLSTDFHEREGLLLGRRPCEEKFSHRLYCTTYDITDSINDGVNILAVSMAGGWYEAGTNLENRNGVYGHAKLSYAISLVDDRDVVTYIISDESAKWMPSFIREYHFYNGEIHDYSDYDSEWNSSNFDDSAWKEVCIEEAPETTFLEQKDYPADKIKGVLKPVLISEKDGKRVYDCGRIITGVVKVKCLQDSENIEIIYDEGLDSDGRPLKLQKEWHGYEQYSKFMNCRKGQILNTLLTWHCFRYFEVTGNAQVVEALIIHSDVSVTSTFECSDETLNWLYTAYLNTQLANMHTGIPSDCPHIERKGYTGDGQLTCDAAMTTLDTKQFYHKWLKDISDCQDQITGAVQYTAPFYDCGGGPGGWGGAIAFVPYTYYKHYGDKSILEEFYPKILHWFRYLESNSENELIVREREGIWFLGDWCLPAQRRLGDRESIKITPEFVNTYFYIKALGIAYEIEEILNIDHGVTDLQVKIEQKKTALIKKYFDPETGNFLQNFQGANAFALDIGLGDKRTFLNMISHYKENPFFDTGIFGTEIVTRILFEKGESELAVRLLTAKEGVGFYREKKTGFSTLWETWNGIRSHCHPMFGAVCKYLFDYILGIRMAEGTTAYKNVIINPLCLESIRWAKGKITTPQGEISVDYDEEYIKIVIPKDTIAIIKVKNVEKQLVCGENIISIKKER